MSRITRRHVLAGGALATLGTPGLASAATARDVDELVTAIFRDKSSRDVDRFMSHFSQQALTYTDGTLGTQFATWAALRAAFAQLMPTWPATQAIRTPPDQFVTDFGEGNVGERAAATMRGVASALANALSAGDTAAAAALFATDAAFDDLTLHTSVVGQPAIRGFLDRSWGLLPYGLGTGIRHTVGSAQGGGLRVVEEGCPCRSWGDRVGVGQPGAHYSSDRCLGWFAGRQCDACGVAGHHS